MDNILTNASMPMSVSQQWEIEVKRNELLHFQNGKLAEEFRCSLLGSSMSEKSGTCASPVFNRFGKTRHFTFRNPLASSTVFISWEIALQE